MEIVKTYVTCTEGTKRAELKFDHVPTNQEIENAFAEVTKPPIEPNQCPMNNVKCPLYKPEEIKL